MKKRMTKEQIRQHLTENPSFFKWGRERLANKYGCSVKTISLIVQDLGKTKTKYLRNLAK